MTLPTDLVAALGWALLDFVWQGAVIGATAATALLLLRNGRPQTRYAVACLALFACLALPLAGTVRGVLGVDESAVPNSEASAFGPGFVAAMPAEQVAASDWRQSLQTQLPAIVAAWSAGALLLATRLLIGFGWVGRLRAGARLPASHWQGRCDELAVRVGLRRPVPLRLSDAIDSPVTAGWWRPVVLVPAALLAGMPADLLEALLAHELAHVRRRDYLVNLLQGAVETLLFYHPVVWWLSRQARVEREQIADDLAARAIGEPRRLALALQALDRIQDSGDARPARLPGLVLAAQGGKLMPRIKRLLRPDPQRPDWKLALPLAGLAALGLAVHAAQATAPVVAAAPAVSAAPSVAAAPSVIATPRVAAVPAVPAVAASAAVAASININREDDNHPAYALVREGDDAMMLSGNTDDMQEVQRTRQHLRGDFLWFRRGSEGYLVQDAALLARANQAWGPVRQMGVKMEALSAQMQPHSERMQELSRQMQKLSTGSEPYQHEMEALGRSMEPLARQQEALSGKMSALAARSPGSTDIEAAKLDASMEQLQTQMEGLGKQMEAISRSMEAKSAAMQRAQAPMEELGRQMEAAGKPMEALGKQMEVLGKQQESLSHTADAEVSRLIDDAFRSGKAVPTRQVAK